MLHLKMRRSDAPPRAAQGASTSRRRSRCPACVRVLTHEDVPNNWYTILRLIGVEPNDEPVLPEDRVLYKGEPIGAVVAETRAGRAARAPPRSRSTYEDLPAVLRRRGGARRRRDRDQAARHELLRLRGPPLPADPLRRRRRRRSRRPTTSSSGATSPRRSSTRRPRPTGCIVVPQADGRLQHPLRHPGVLLHARQHGADPRRRRSTSCASSAARSAAASAARST